MGHTAGFDAYADPFRWDQKLYTFVFAHNLCDFNNEAGRYSYEMSGK
jgi:hypothetical protein